MWRLPPPHQRPRRTLLRAGLAGALVVAAAAPASAQAGSAFVGMTPTVSTAYGTPNKAREAELSGMARAGVGTIRQTVDVSRGPIIDADVLEAARHGIRVLPLLLDGRRFSAAPGPNHGTHPPARFSNYARDVGKLVHRYGPKGTLWKAKKNRKLRRYAIRTWQIWNEPNLPVWWLPRPNPRAFAGLVKGAAKAIRRYDRHATIVSGGIPNSGQSYPYNYAQYLTKFLQAGGGRWVNTIGVHAYSPSVAGLGSVLHTYRHILNRHHGRRLKLWITEFGWADAGPANRYVVGRRGQAQRVAGAFRLIRRLRRSYRIVGAAYFDWRDVAPLNGHADTWGFHTGLLTRGGKAKAAYTAFKRAVKHL